MDSRNLADDICKNLKKEEVICLPTDTVWGFLCSSSSINAVKRIYQLKNRSFTKPLALIVSNPKMAESFAYVSKKAEKLLNFKELSITVILPGKLTTGLARNINLKNQTVALRIPKSSLLKEIVSEMKQPVVASSANISGIANIDKIFLKKLFGKAVQFYDLDEGGKGEESPIIDYTGSKPKVIRSTPAQDKILSELL